VSVLLRQPRGFEGFAPRVEPHHPHDLAVADRPYPGVGMSRHLDTAGPPTNVVPRYRNDLLTYINEFLAAGLDVLKRFTPLSIKTPETIVATIDRVAYEFSKLGVGD
jgi:hypothetical protein